MPEKLGKRWCEKVELDSTSGVVDPASRSAARRLDFQPNHPLQKRRSGRPGAAFRQAV